MAKKKFFLDKKSKKERKKTLDELKKRDIEIEDDDQVSGGNPQWIESPIADDNEIKPKP